MRLLILTKVAISHLLNCVVHSLFALLPSFPSAFRAILEEQLQVHRFGTPLLRLPTLLVPAAAGAYHPPALDNRCHLRKRNFGEIAREGLNL